MSYPQVGFREDTGSRELELINWVVVLSLVVGLVSLMPEEN